MKMLDILSRTGAHQTKISDDTTEYIIRGNNKQ